MFKDIKKPKWTNLPEFASDKVGGKIIFCTDEFFAAAERMIKFNDEISHWNEYNYVVVNDDLEECYNKI